MAAFEEKKYDNNGCLIVSELSRCAFFERDTSVLRSSDFRKREYIERVESEARKGILYSVCHNEKNKAEKI